jgi:6-phosphogluconolactonase
LILFALLSVIPLSLVLAQDAPKKYHVYIGTYTRGEKSEGIYRVEMDALTGKLSAPVLAAKTVNPTFLALHPSGKFLYAVGEIGDFADAKKKGVGGISAFAIESGGDLKLLNAKSSEGNGPCHIVLDKAGKYALCANYGGGNAAALPIGDDGKVGDATGFVQHKGSSVIKGRQKQPHAHSINLSPDGKFAYVADLGIDKVMGYAFKDGKFDTTGSIATPVKPGAGPRHFAFHTSGKYAYVINELDSTITAFDFDAKTGKLTETQTISTLPEGFKGNTTTAEVVVHPSGRFVYGSNRGHNSIAIFQVDEATGKLTAAGHQGKGVKVPRNFAIEPTGKFCVVANQEANTVIVFKIDPKTGALEPTDISVPVAKPVCVRFLPLE